VCHGAEVNCYGQIPHIFFNLAGGAEIVEDSKDLFIFIKQTKIPFSVFYHSISTNNEYDEITKVNFQFIINKSIKSFIIYFQMASFAI
jgi:hypothetical protein